MGNRRMLNKNILEGDSFLFNLSTEAKALYTYINLEADDEGFCGRTKAIQRLLGLDDQALQELINGDWLIAFQDSSVVCVTDWWRNNTLNANRSAPTEFAKERSQLAVDQNKRYCLAENGQGLTEPYYKIKAQHHINGKTTQDNDVRDIIQKCYSFATEPYLDWQQAMTADNSSIVKTMLTKHPKEQVLEAMNKCSESLRGQATSFDDFLRQIDQYLAN